MAAFLAPLSVLALLAAPARAPRQEAAGATRIALRESPVVDLFFHVRALAAGNASPSEAFAPAVEAAKELHRALGGNTLAWGPLAGLLPGCESAADVVGAFERAPETLELRGGTKMALRAGAVKLAQALVQAEPAFLQELWKEHAERTRAARARWMESVGPKEDELFAFHLASLGMSDPRLSIPVFLVAEAPWPFAVTHLDDEGRGVCFVGMEGTEGSQLYETVLHEATHALDVATNDESALGELRRKLEAAGHGPPDRAYHDLPHALMFVQSGESIRREIDPAHVDYGESQKVYERMGQAVEALRGFWRDHLDGKLSRSEALDGIVESLATPK